MRFKGSHILSLLIALAVFGWMFSDDIFPSYAKDDSVVEDDEYLKKSSENNTFGITVSAIEVKNEETDIKIRASGVTRTEFEIDLFARRNAFVNKILVGQGNWVKKGQLIISLDKSTLASDLDAAKAELKAAKAAYMDTVRKFDLNGPHEAQIISAEADLDLNSRNYEIAKKLSETGVQSQVSLIQKRALLKAAETRLFELKAISKELELANSDASVKTIEARIKRLEEQIDFTSISSPQRGWVEKLDIEEGEFVDTNRPFGKLIGLQSIVLDMPIPQTNIGSVQVNDKVEVDFGSLGKRIGIVKEVSMTANSSTRTFNVEVYLDNTNDILRAGMSAEASIITEKVNAFKVSPAHLNVDENGQLSVKVAVDNIVQTIPVKLLRTTGNYAFISGLKNGDILLTSGQAFLSDGEFVSFSFSGES
tara:strand:+ start:724 stop:1989 length:1266 start_codon:yes stop_codon:yes gene_type:complete